MQLLVGERADFARLALPNDGGFIFAPSLHVAVEAVVGEIHLAADKPFGPGAIPFEDLVPLFEPVEFVGNFGPKLFGVFDGFFVDALVVFEALDVGLLAEFFRAFELALFLQDRSDVG